MEEKDKKVGGIYIIRNIINEKVYIGQTTNFNYRKTKHKSELKNNTHHNCHLQRAYNKYGKESFKFEIIEICEEEILNEREQFYLDEYGGINSELNYNTGPICGGSISQEIKDKISKGNKGKKRTEETRQKMRQPKSKEHVEKMRIASTGRKHSQEARKNMSKAQKGHKPWNKGRKCTEEENKRNSEGQKGKKLSEETKKKIGDSSRGRKMPEIVKIKLIATNKGNKYMLGKKHSEESKKKMSEAQKGKPSKMKGKKLSQEHVEKIRQANMGHTVSEETREKLRKANIENLFSTKDFQEKMRNMNKKNQKPFIAFDINGNASMHYNKSKFERDNNVSRINNYLNGRNKNNVNKGWTFKNYEEGDEEKYGFEYKDRK